MLEGDAHPGLYYLQYVDCVMPTNEHVESGLHDHRRVDEPGLANRSRKDGDAVRTRGVQLSSESLGICGVLDLIEERQDEWYPVETKHGGAPRDEAGRPTTWENDAVQLCAQGMLLEEAYGRPVTGDGFLYNMVRAIVGTLVEVGKGSRDVGWPAEVLAKRDRRCAGQTAPPRGLFLVRVDY